MNRLPLIGGCTLSPDGLDQQRERARRSSSSVADVELGQEYLAVRFGPEVDDELVAELVAVESECCSFFSIRYDAEKRALRLTVEDEQRRPALAAFAGAFRHGNEP